MKTPINDFIKKYSLSESVRLHMPGHKGVSKTGVERMDITEIDGADELFHPSGIIKKSQDNASKIFGANTFYSVEGSSLSIRAMVLLASKFALKNGKKPCILAGRNSHKSFLSALSFCDAEVEWLYPENGFNYLSFSVNESTLDNRLCELKDKVSAVYLTSPDYLGNLLDIAALGKVCKKHGVLLMVDNAHGSYLKFLDKSSHPIDLGADMCADSAHKTLSALTGAGYLHINKKAPEFLKENARECMEVFASTSPSYLILNSLDLLNSELCGDYKNRLKVAVKRVEELKEKLTNLGLVVLKGEPLKLTLDLAKIGNFGDKVAKMLKKQGVVVEFSDSRYVVMMFSADSTPSDFEKAFNALQKIKIKKPIIEEKIDLKPIKKLSLRQALLSNTETIKVQDAGGKIVASFSLSCPPAVAIAVPGEIIDDSVIKVLKENKIDTIKVVKE